MNASDSETVQRMKIVVRPPHSGCRIRNTLWHVLLLQEAINRNDFFLYAQSLYIRPRPVPSWL